MHRGPLSTIVILSLFGSLVIGLDSGMAQTKGSENPLVGTWKYLSVDTVQPDGTRIPLFGTHPSGLASFDGNGHYILFTARSGRPPFASNSRMNGTADENRAVVQGSIAHFGLYTVDERAKTITFQIDTSSFPNWNGVEQRRPFTLEGDQLRWTTAASNGGIAEVLLRRVR